MPIFRQSRFRVSCERCHANFAAGHGGVCHQCRAVLCDTHLHRSTWRKLVRELVGAAPVCERCASQGAIQPTA